MSGKGWNDRLALVGWARPTIPKSLSSGKIGRWAEPTLREREDLQHHFPDMSQNFTTETTENTESGERKKTFHSNSLSEFSVISVVKFFDSSESILFSEYSVNRTSAIRNISRKPDFRFGLTR
jgi:hypothetical protein